jgi:hypothetical protein
MKKLVLILMFALVAIFSADAKRYRPAYVSITIQSFYDELAPFGDWIYTPEYGYVWRPYFDRPEAFRPYSSNGDWVYTEYGWTWVSDYRWGWAPFHYGRWYFDDYMGWMWIPGYEWAPAWVTWGSYNDYYGWAPLGPDINVNVNFNWFAPDPWWTFVPCRHFFSNNWRNYIYDRPVHITNITNITNIYVGNNERGQNQWFRGPRVNDVERYTRKRVRTMGIVESERPDNSRIENGRVNIYSPRVEQGRDNYRPSESRTIENSRSGNRLQQNPRSIDPGINRTRDSRNDIRQDNRVPNERQSAEPRNQPRMNNSENEKNNNNAIENKRKSESAGVGNQLPNSRGTEPGQNTRIEKKKQNESNNARNNINKTNTERKVSGRNGSSSKKRDSGTDVKQKNERNHR